MRPLWMGLMLMAAVPLRIVALGDSTTAGTPYFRSPLEEPPDGEGDASAPFPHAMEQLRPQWRVLNQGVNGERTDQIHHRLPAALAEKPQWIIVLAGVNDVYQGRPDGEIQAELASIYSEIRAAKVTPVAATILPFTAASARQSAAIRRMNAWIQAEAKRQRIPFCDTHQAAANPEQPDALRGTPEGLHPDKPTYRAVGEALVKCIEAANEAGVDAQRAR